MFQIGNIFVLKKIPKTFFREATLVEIATIIEETKKKHVEQRPLGKTTEG